MNKHLCFIEKFDGEIVSIIPFDKISYIKVLSNRLALILDTNECEYITDKTQLEDYLRWRENMQVYR